MRCYFGHWAFLVVVFAFNTLFLCSFLGTLTPPYFVDSLFYKNKKNGRVVCDYPHALLMFFNYYLKKKINETPKFLRCHITALFIRSFVYPYPVQFLRENSIFWKYIVIYVYMYIQGEGKITRRLNVWKRESSRENFE